MARRLGGENTLWMEDDLSGSRIGLNYRMPAPAEIISYRNGNTRREGNRLVQCIGENRLKHGKKILTGVADGSFEKMASGAWVPVSSDPKSKDYDPAWKDIVCDQAPDLIETLCVKVFDGSVRIVDEEVEPEGEDHDSPE